MIESEWGDSEEERARERDSEEERERNGKKIREDTIGPTGSRFRGQMTLKLFTTHTHQFVFKKYKHKHISLFFTIKPITVSHFSHRIFISFSIFISLPHFSFFLVPKKREKENVFHRMSDPLE